MDVKFGRNCQDCWGTAGLFCCRIGGEGMVAGAEDYLRWTVGEGLFL